MEINDALGVGNSSVFPTTTNEEVLGKDDFLKLLVTQMTNQDPLEPQEPGDFSAQLAQFSSLEQLTQMNELLTSSVNTNLLVATSINNTMAANVIGKQVKALGAETYYDGNNNAPLMYDIAQQADTLTIEIVDGDGKVIRTAELNGVAAGEHTYDWDGQDDQGNVVDADNYAFRVKATTEGGTEINALTYMSGMVTGIRYGSNGPTLLVGNTEIRLSNVLEIILPTNSGGSSGNPGGGDVPGAQGYPLDGN